MALTTLVPQALTGSGGTPAIISAVPIAATDGWVVATSDFQYPNDGKTILMISNGSASPTTVAFTLAAGQIGGLSATPAAGGVLLAGKIYQCPPLPMQFNNASGNIVGTLTAFPATVLLKAVVLP